MVNKVTCDICGVVYDAQNHLTCPLCDLMYEDVEVPEEIWEKVEKELQEIRREARDKMLHDLGYLGVGYSSGYK